MPWKLIWETLYEIFVPMLVMLWRSLVWKGKSKGSGFCDPNSNWHHFEAQESNCETSLLLDPKLEPKLWKKYSRKQGQDLWVRNLIFLIK
jgi:hypothetical protein